MLVHKELSILLIIKSKPFSLCWEVVLSLKVKNKVYRIKMNISSLKWNEILKENLRLGAIS